MRKLLKNFCIWFLLKDFDLSEAERKTRMTKDNIMKAYAEVYDNKNYIAIQKAIIINDIERNLLDQDKDKVTFRRGSAYRTFRELIKLEQYWKKFNKLKLEEKVAANAKIYNEKI